MTEPGHRYQGPERWPLRTLALATHSSGVRTVAAVWLATCLVSFASGLLSVALRWNGIPLELGGLTVDVTFYPPLILTFLLAIWLGPGWSVPPAYLTTLAMARYSGMAWDTSLVFALASPIEVMVLWGSMVFLNVDPTLRRARDLLLMLVIALVALAASSVAIVLWNVEHELDVLAGQRLWRGWVIGAFVQVALVMVPILRWTTGPVTRWLRLRMPEAAHGELRPMWGVVLAVAVLVMLAGVLGVGTREVILSLTTAGGVSRLPDTVIGELTVYLSVAFGMMLLTVAVFSMTLARASEREHRWARQDSLTGCYNRRAFFELFKREADRSHRLGRGLAVILCDLDHFKAVNDRYGHLVGDEVLQHAVALIQTELRDTDLLFRWGGEEFLVLLAHTAPEDALPLAERIRAAVQAVPMRRPGGTEPIRVTMSLGTAGATLLPVDPDALVRRADTACYAAKRQGRNRVVAAPPPAPSSSVVG